MHTAVLSIFILHQSLNALVSTLIDGWLDGWISWSVNWSIVYIYISRSIDQYVLIRQCALIDWSGIKIFRHKHCLCFMLHVIITSEVHYSGLQVVYLLVLFAVQSVLCSLCLKLFTVALQMLFENCD